MDIDQYYDQIMTEVEGLSSPLSASDSHDFKDENFSSLMLKHMSELGLTFEEPEIIRYFAKIGNANLLLSGYAIAGDGEDIDLYITNFSESSTLVNAPDREILKKAEACIRFLSAASTGKLGDKVDSRHPVYSLVKHLEFGFEDLRKIRVIVLTNSIVKTRSYKPREVLGKTIQLEVMDFQRFYNQSLEGTARDEIEINFEELGYKLPILWIPGQVEEYDYAVTVIPGDVLRHLYEVYGTRILEANVRSFLNTTGKTNAGILRTLTYSPERFMAYNNGIVILADEIVTVDEGQGVSLVYIKGRQIVNGGQTTASLYFGKRKNASIDLSNVRVAAKIVVPRKRDGDSQELLVSDISKYANTQNVVRSSDLSSNAAIHIAIEKIANKTFCPDGIGKWFYERSTGSYRVFLDREGRTPAGIKQLKTIIPNHRKILKTDVAKYLCAWEVKPNLVALGGQKNFA